MLLRRVYLLSSIASHDKSAVGRYARRGDIGREIRLFSHKDVAIPAKQETLAVAAETACRDQNCAVTVCGDHIPACRHPVLERAGVGALGGVGDLGDPLVSNLANS